MMLPRRPQRDTLQKLQSRDHRLLQEPSSSSSLEDSEERELSASSSLSQASSPSPVLTRSMESHLRELTRFTPSAPASRLMSLASKLPSMTTPSQRRPRPREPNLKSSSPRTPQRALPQMPERSSKRKLIPLSSAN